MYAGWGFSQAFYWEKEYEKLGYTSLEDFLVGFWEGFFLDGRDPNNLLTMLWTWQNGDVGLTPGFDGDTEAALASIKATTLVHARREGPLLPAGGRGLGRQPHTDAELRVIPGIWGHFAGGGSNPKDTEFIDAGIKELLAKPGGLA